MKSRMLSNTSPRNQRGVTLYVALVLLLLLTLIGLAAVQTTLLQERMAGNYRTIHLAFQNAESRVRDSELEIGRVVGAGNLPTMTQDGCEGYDIDSWASEVDVSDANEESSAVRTRRVDVCSGSSSARYGSKLNDDTNSIYQITGAASDRAADGSSVVVLETVYIP